MMRFINRIIFTFVVLVSFVIHARAENFYSVASLTLMCGSPDSQLESTCGAYIRAVVESWMVKDLVSVDPYKYSSQNGTATYCDAIGYAAESDWVQTVRKDLKGMQPGFASGAVMHSLSKRYCK